METLFTILEGTLISMIDGILYAHTFAVLRYIPFHREVLHRDVSEGNDLSI